MSAVWGGLRSRTQSWFRAVTGRGRLEREMEAELHFHLDARAADLRAEGLSEKEAMRRARVEFGGMETHLDGMRESLGLRWWDEMWADLRYGARVLRRSPGFTAIAVISLGLAIGANTTIFSVANELLYARLAVPRAKELRLLEMTGDKGLVVHSSWGSWYSDEVGRKRFNSFSYPVYEQMRRENRVMGEIFGVKELGQVNVTANGEAEAAQLQLVSGNFYTQMEVRPVLGRPLLPADDGGPGTGAVAVISYGFWTRAFGRSADAVGRVIAVNTIPVTIVGVNPEGYTGAMSVQESPELFMPLSMIPLLRAEIGHEGPMLSSMQLWWVQLMARTKPGVADEQARAALDVALNAAVRGTMKVKEGDTLPRLVLEDGSRGLNLSGQGYGKPMHVLLGMVGFLLLLACANIANLTLARASVRQREMGVRLALGAGQGRVLRQVLTESLMLSGMGGALGLGLGAMGRTLLPKLLAHAWEQKNLQVPFDWRVFAFTAAVTVLTGLLFGIAPAWSATRAEIGTALKEGGKTATRQRKGLSGRSLVALQVALSTVLVVGAGLFLRTLYHLNSIDPGFNPDGLVLFEVNPPSKQYPAPKDVALLAQVEDAIGRVPGVEGVSLTDVPLLANSSSSSGFWVEGQAENDGKDGKEIYDISLASVGQDFLQVMQIPLVAGRRFTQADAEGTQRVAMVDEALARRFFPAGDALGRRFTIYDASTKDRKWTEIVGVTKDVRYSELREGPKPIHFDLYRQATEMGGATYMVRTKVKPEAIVPSLRTAVQRVDRDLPLMNVRTQRQQIDATMQQERMFASLTAGFGVLALGLACVGIYGVLAYTVSQRTNEIGIRLALGAARGQVRAMVLREAGWVAVVGVAFGLGAALLLGRLVKGMLYGLKPADPVSLAGAGCLLLGVALLAGWVPAVRASRVEPMEALRHE